MCCALNTKCKMIYKGRQKARRTASKEASCHDKLTNFFIETYSNLGYTVRRIVINSGFDVYRTMNSNYMTIQFTLNTKRQGDCMLNSQYNCKSEIRVGSGQGC